MEEVICLAPEEVIALRKVLAMLAVIEQRAYTNGNRTVTITHQMWLHELVLPAQPLLRVTQHKIGDST